MSSHPIHRPSTLRRGTAPALALAVPAALAQPYDFSDASLLLSAELPRLNGHVAVIVRQGDTDLYRFQAGDIDYSTKTRLASFTKTISGAVILSLLDDGLLTLDERLGDTFPSFEMNGIGDPTVLDAWAMRHGIQTPIAYEHDPRFTLAESVVRIGLTGFLVFEPGTRLGYDGAGMQTVGRIAELRAGQSWAQVARSRIFDRCDMPEADYLQFDPNPAIAGGLRSSADETIRFAEMVVDGGMYDGAAVLSPASIARMFTNATRDLPVHASPWPPAHPAYPYGVDPDYAFGSWVLAENPATQHVEEIVGAGAWGSFIWIDRRREITAVLITDIPAGSQGSLDAALGLFAVARRETENAQVRSLQAVQIGESTCLTWERPVGSTASRIYGADAPIRDIFDLRAATALGQVEGASATATSFDYYAVTAVFDAFENRALIPASNAGAALRPDLDGNGEVGIADLAILLADFGSSPASAGDVDRDGDTDLADLAALLASFGRAGC